MKFASILALALLLCGCATIESTYDTVANTVEYAVCGDENEAEQLDAINSEVDRLELELGDYWVDVNMTYEVEMDHVSAFEIDGQQIHPKILREIKKGRSDSLKNMFLIEGYVKAFRQSWRDVREELSAPDFGLARGFDNAVQDFGIIDDSVRDSAKTAANSFNALREMEYQLIYDSIFENYSSTKKWHNALITHKERTKYFNEIIDSLNNRAINIGKDRLDPADAVEAIGSTIKDKVEE